MVRTYVRVAVWQSDGHEADAVRVGKNRWLDAGDDAINLLPQPILATVINVRHADNLACVATPARNLGSLIDVSNKIFPLSTE